MSDDNCYWGTALRGRSAVAGVAVAAAALSIVLVLSGRLPGSGEAVSGPAAVVLEIADKPDADDKDRVDFASQILPILSDNCFACHGVDAKTREADLRLDLRESAVDEALAITPGDAATSLLVERITSKRPREQMPPPAFNKTLEPAEVELIKRWIDQGAEYAPHWAFVKPEQAALPAVERVDWPVNAIDRFVLARHEALGVDAAAEADRRTLIRRVTLDLTGLPPTVEEVKAFVNDEAPNAYDKVVDRLLASPPYGEHMSRYWLDAVRYGDTHGLHLDNYRSIWPYRDWVIEAFNENMPFDQFTIEQLAGDLMEDATVGQQVASGYNRCHITTAEGGTIPEEVHVRNVIDRVETTGTIWLGLTTGCASCHDHKYDPITQKEFYELYAFFNSFDGNPRDGNRAEYAPVVRVPDKATQARLAELDGKLEKLDTAITERKGEAEKAFEVWLEEQDKKRVAGQITQPKMPSEGLIVHCPFDESEGSEVENAVKPDRAGQVKGKARWTPGVSGGGFSFAGGDRIEFGTGDADVEQDSAFSYGCWVKTPGNVTGAAVAKMDERNGYRGWDLYVTNRRVAMHLIHRWPGKALKVTTKADVLKPNTWHHVFITYDGSKKATGVKVYIDGKPQPFDASHDTLDGSTLNNAPLTLGSRTPGGPLNGCSIDDVRVYNRVLSQQEVGALVQGNTIGSVLALSPDKRTDAQVQALRNHYLTAVEKKYPALLAEREQVRQERDQVHRAAPATLVYKETKQPRKAFILERGLYDQKGDEVGRGVPAFLPPMGEDLPRNRLGFARWLVSPDHPLTARVTVNRFWQQLFGTGLVKTSEDFGVQGEQPSHPELLDWLALQFIADGWDVKRTMKRMVMSATYRQSASVSPEQYKQDPDNRLLARGPRLRLDAETLRDQALAVSGLLNGDIGGPSVKPPQPAGIWKAVGYESSNTANFVADTGDKVFRRSLYIFWKRTAPPPQMAIFDAPNREACTVRRERTNTAMQALVILNEPQYVESARRLGERAMKEAEGDDAARLTWMVEQTLLREPTDAERAILLEGYREQLAYYRADVEAAKSLIATGTSKPDPALEPAELAAWTMTASTLMNLDEFINKP